MVFSPKNPNQFFCAIWFKYTQYKNGEEEQDEEEEAESLEEERNKEEEGGAEDEDEDEDYAELTKFRSRRSSRTTQANQ